MKDWIKQAGTGIFYGLIGGAIGLAILAMSSNNHDTFGNVADWVSGIGSVGAIYFVYRQIKQQTDQHNEEKGHYLQLAIGFRMLSNQSDKAGTVSIKSEQEVFFFGTNSGMMPSAFKFIGICTSEDYQTLKSNHDKSQIDHNYEDPEIQSFDCLYDLGIKQRKFERVVPGDVSEEIVIPMKLIQNKFEGSGKNLFVVYMDVLGVIYGRQFTIPDLNV
ncbi:hypothetical protein EFN63_08095 [Leuconostoc citreum]|uniref:Uncharacterized protein n=1 Tax=Leuconostoc citreum TaxID=33964 RepID=A0A5A5U4N9_LEUCI|nr:hypothetical protein [Leuconostoc citreum]MCT3068313.1 hypothetical protein [Leuconostoc citreum]OSP82555.1 hypothetical protein B9J75_03625 [Leuconostoc citreum]TDG65405.1 hypothetical protein C5L21_000608 [Leuconostoc citreum]UVW15871.1 hypothetical protein NX813_05480 [Leuconostoc citreum]GDZ84756.1 hypothetical protein LCIT_19980 [Leuconostoc citreum]